MPGCCGLVEIDGQIITARNLADAVSAIMQRLDQDHSFLVCTLNLDHLVKLRVNPRFRKAYTKAEVVLADGFPIVTFARRCGVALERASGSDLLDPLCRAAAVRGFPIYLFGTSLRTLCAAGRELAETIPKLEIAGAYALRVTGRLAGGRAGCRVREGALGDFDISGKHGARATID